MKRSISGWVCLAAVFGLMVLLRVCSGSLLAWQSDLSGRAALGLLKGLPYLGLGLAALWAKKIANAPVFVLALILIPSQYYFSGGPVWLGGADQMRFVLFMILPLAVTLASFVSHRTLACSLKTALVVLALGFVIPPLASLTFGRPILSWVGEHRWAAAGILGAPSAPTLYYLGILALNLILPFDGREGQMKKILASTIPCFYFSGVFRPIFQSGPLHPPGLEETSFVVFTSAASVLTLYANFFLSWTKAYVDDLTQVLGRRALNEALTHLNGRFSIAMVDVDHFKQFNDTYGHAAGDVVLREVAALLSETSGGQVYRYGGEEFSVLFPEMDADTALVRMDEFRSLLAETKISLNGASGGKRDKKVTVNISAGVAEAGKKQSTAEDVLRSADQALYKAKGNGRNRVEKF